MSKDPGEHPSHYVWGDFLAEARAERQDPPPTKLECFEGGYDKGYAAGLAAGGANEAVPEPSTDSTVLINHLRRAITRAGSGSLLRHYRSCMRSSSSLGSESPVADVTARHRRIAIIAEYTETALNLVTIREWVETGLEGQPPWDRSAQALADIEAEALASKPTLYEAHGIVVAGPPGDANGTGCLLCDMTQTIGDHDPNCDLAAAVKSPRVLAHLERASELLSELYDAQLALTPGHQITRSKADQDWIDEEHALFDQENTR
jgi:hypothetical protein